MITRYFGLMSVEDSGSYAEPTNQVSQGANPPIEVIPAAPFTLAAAGFVHVMAHARMTSTDEWGGYGTCDGSPGNGPALVAVIDGTLHSSLSGELNPGPGTSGRASQDSFWLGAGTHEITFEFTPNACAATADGTTHVDQLAVSVVAYQ